MQVADLEKAKGKCPCGEASRATSILFLCFGGDQKKSVSLVLSFERKAESSAEPVQFGTPERWVIR